jgi:membrane protein
MAAIKQLSGRVIEELWEKDLTRRKPAERFLIRLGRMIFGVARKFVDNDFSMRAMSLVYTTLMSLVPLLALSFSVLRAFGVHNQLEPALLEFLDPLGAKKTEVVTNIVTFVENLRLGVLSSLGMAMLIYTIVSMTHKVEKAFNDVWHVSKPRSLARRFSDYLSVIIVGPVLVFSALSMTRALLHSSVMQYLASVEPFGMLLYSVGLLVPYLLVCGAFAFLYGFVPNTKVKLTTALVGGVFAGVLWSGASMIFANLVVNSSNYSAIYAGFASIVLFMVWIYLCWLIILVGAQVTFYWQNPRYLDPRMEKARLSSREREELTIELMTLIAHAHYHHQPLWTANRLDQYHYEVRPDVLAELLNILEKHKLIVATNGNTPAYLPARDAGTIKLQEIVRIVRGEDLLLTKGTQSVNDLMDQVDGAIAGVLGERTIRDLIVNQSHISQTTTA